MKERPFPLQLSRLAKATDADLSLASLGTKDGSHLFTRLSSKETEFSKRMEVLREHGLIRPITIRNGTESTNHDYIVVGGRPVIHANIHGVTVPMYMTSGQAAKIDGQKLKLPGFLPFGGVLADGYFSKLHHDGPADESNGWGNRHIQRFMQVLKYNLFGDHIPPRRVYSRNDLPEALHLTEYTPEEKKVNGETQYENFAPVMIPITPEQEMKNRAIKKQIQSLATAQSAVLPATGHDPLQNTEDHRARGGEALPATIAAITSQIDANAGMETAPGSGVTHEKMLGAKIARVHKIAAVRNSMLQANGLANMTVPAATPVAKSRMTAPFPLQLSLLAKASIESTDPNQSWAKQQDETWTSSDPNRSLLLGKLRNSVNRLHNQYQLRPGAFGQLAVDNPRAFTGYAEATRHANETGLTVQAHGMNKDGDYGSATGRWISLFTNGLDPNRPGLYTDAVAAPRASAGAGAGSGSADGEAYRDGGFQLLVRPGKTLQIGPDNPTGLAHVSHVVVDQDAHENDPSFLGNLQAYIGATGHQVKVIPQSQVGKAVKELHAEHSSRNEVSLARSLYEDIPLHEFYNQLSKSKSSQIPDFTNFYNTVLTPDEEQQFDEWKTGMEATGAKLGMHDYDIKGAWKSGVKPDGNLHWDDSFKKPNHPTFSSYSIYAEQQKPKDYVPTASEPRGRPAGGEWIDHKGDQTHWTFVPSDHVMSVRSPEQMLEYFNQHEPHNNVVLGGEVHVGTKGKGEQDDPSHEVVERATPPEAPLRNSFYEDMPLHEIYNQLFKAYKTPAWQRAEGQNPKGGLNAKGRASAKAEGHNLKAPVKSGDNPRRASFLARMGNSPGPEYDEHGKPTRLLLSLQAWGASSKADARRKAKAISARLKARE